MTIDKFLKIFEKCPVCGSRIVFDNKDTPSFHCDAANCIVMIPGLNSNKTNVDMVLLYANGHVYEFFDRELQVYLDDGKDEKDILGNIFCGEELMVQLFSKPSNINKLLIVN